MENLKSSIASHIRAAQTPAEEFRTSLGQLEARVGKLGFGTDEDPVETLLLMDHAKALLQELTEQGADLSGERKRLETIIQQYRSKGKKFIKAAGGRTAFQKMRAAQTVTPPQENWWWYLDELLDEAQRTRRTQTLRSLGIVTASLIVLSAIYMLFLRPDEATRMRYRYEQDAERSLMAGDPVAALPAVEQALSYAPDDGDLLVMYGVTLHLLDREEAAQTEFARAQARFESEADYYSARAQAYMIGNRPDLAILDTRHMIEMDENNAFAHFQMGNANASLGNYYEATTNYETAGELARAAGQTELEGMARVQLANLMMLLMSPQMDTGTQQMGEP